MVQIHCENIEVSYGNINIIKDLNISIHLNKITALVGANGSGKSTILKILSRIMHPTKGDVYLDGKSIHSYSNRDIAKILSILPQSPEAPQEFTVEQLVLFGRFSRQSFFGMATKEDHEAVEWALNVTGMNFYRDRKLAQLSGGQRQRVWIALALAQGGDILFLDEPTTYLDMRHQIEVLSILEKLNKDQNKTIVMVVHDINHAARYAHRIIAIKKGKVICEGNVGEVMNAVTLEKIFGVCGEIIMQKENSIPLFFPSEVSYA